MRIAAIDIGSNAIRLQIVRVIDQNNLVSFKNLELLRFPLRLGKDVFKNQRISSETKKKFIKLMKVFKILMDLYEVTGYKAVATSAMREASNGDKIQKEVLNEVGLEIEIITGKNEAKILNKAIVPFLSHHYYMHIDVGGGSTELNVFKGKKLLKSKSFQLGSVRKLKAEDRTATFKMMKEWIKNTDLHHIKNVTGIGTGGNINKLYKLANKAKGIEISLAELKGLRSYLKEFTYEERLNILKLNEDRADVIIPASEIYIKVLQFCHSDHIMVPKVGLKDGLVYELFEKVSGRKLHEIEYLEVD